MCGIAGFNFKDPDLIRKMADATKHRGPDGSGFFVDELVSLGHNLLAITDTPEAGRQPFYSDDGNFVLIYNGEIYNYKELKEELTKTGHRFRTQGDTEVLLQGLIRSGAAFIKKLNGMFTFAFYNVRAGKLILARDRMGMKPVYYWVGGKKFIFSSELRGVLSHPVPRQLDHDALAVFFELGYVPGPKTFIKDITKLCPGQYLELDVATGEYRVNWFSESSASLDRQNFSIDKFRGLMKDVVSDHTMGLRPFGMYLSGGLDSSVILHELLQNGIKNVATYTTRFDGVEPRYNEDADIAARFSEQAGAKHHELLVTEDDFVGALKSVLETIEEPRYHPSIPAYYLLAKFASKDIVVALTGDGGDELFMGYPKYYESRRMSNRYRKYPPALLDIYYSLKELYKGRNPLGTRLNLRDPIHRWWYFNKIVTTKEYSSVNLKRSPAGVLGYLRSIGAPAISDPVPDPENNLAELDRLFWLAEDSFILTDKIGMHFGLEARFPFADRRVVEYAAAISSKEKMDSAGTKGLIRQAYKGMLPDYVLNKRKSGWTAPAAAWMSKGLGSMVREVLSPGFYAGTKDLFDFHGIAGSHLNSREFSQRSLKHLFPMFTFQLWAKQFNIKL